MLAALPSFFYYYLFFHLRAVRVNAERYVGIRARNLPTRYDCQLEFPTINTLQLAIGFLALSQLRKSNQK